MDIVLGWAQASIYNYSSSLLNAGSWRRRFRSLPCELVVIFYFHFCLDVVFPVSWTVCAQLDTTIKSLPLESKLTHRSALRVAGYCVRSDGFQVCLRESYTSVWNKKKAATLGNLDTIQFLFLRLQFISLNLLQDCEMKGIVSSPHVTDFV